MINFAGITSDNIVLVTAGSSSADLSALQIAKAEGVTVIGQPRTVATRNFMRKASADCVVVIDEEDLAQRVMAFTAGRGFKFSYDPIGGHFCRNLIAAAQPGAKIINYGKLDPSLVDFPILLILFSLGHHMRTLRAYEASAAFAVNVLHMDQKEISTQFASQSVADKWAGVAYTISDHGCPLIDGALATFECESWERHHGGDHIIFVGRVVRATANVTHHPLVFYRGKYHSLSGAG